jgi:TolB-like protein
VAESDRKGQAKGDQAAPRDIFLSYASRDAIVADAVVAALERSNISCWIAPRDVTPGEFYAGAIVRAIDAAKAIVLILSGSAAVSPHVLREVERAASNRHPVIAMRIDQASMPAELEYFLNSSQWLAATEGDITNAIPRLISAVRLAIDRPATSTVASSAAPPARPHEPAPSTDWPLPRIAIAVGLVAVAAIAAFAAFRAWQPSRSPVVPSATSEAGAGQPVTYGVPTIPQKSVAVLPFVDMSEKKDQEYFADGLTEELIDLLARGSDIKIPARTSSFYFKGRQATVAEIAKALGVAHLLEGSVRKVGNTMRITVQLIRAADGYHIWSSSYDRDTKTSSKYRTRLPPQRCLCCRPS